jgi:purine-nucleoside phosphorylase
LKVIDFTGQIPAAHQFTAFSPAVIDEIRKGSGNLIVLDSGFGFAQPEPHIVADHLNFTGGNPLVGPNDPCGQRFPVINDIYISEPPHDRLRALKRGIVGGLKQDVRPSKEEEAKLRSLGAEFFSYNLAQTMIVAGHAGRRVIGLVLPADVPLAAEIVAAVKELSDRELAR